MSISGISANRTTGSTSLVQPGTQALGKDEFMQILVAQLRFQDPLRPLDDREFISQMAQFSSLEQMQNLNSEFSKTKAIEMVGKFITARLENSNSNDDLFSGIVDSVRFENGRIFAVVGDTLVNIEDVVSVATQNEGSSFDTV